MKVCKESPGEMIWSLFSPAPTILAPIARCVVSSGDWQPEFRNSNLAHRIAVNCLSDIG
jgi:hypothetical protein